jgi:hypothetical protein
MGRAVQAGLDDVPLIMNPVEWVRFVDDMKAAGEPIAIPPDNCYREPPVKLLGVPIRVVCPHCSEKEVS